MKKSYLKVTVPRLTQKNKYQCIHECKVSKQMQLLVVKHKKVKHNRYLDLTV